jgi:hypothetical protein
MSGKLIFLDELEKLDVVVLELQLGFFQSLVLFLPLDIQFFDAVLNDVLRQLYKEHLFLLLNEVIDVLLIFPSAKAQRFKRKVQARFRDVHGGRNVSALL